MGWIIKLLVGWAVGTASLLPEAEPAKADTADYCAAYARDFADAGKRNEAIWQHRFGNAKSACLLQFTAVARVAAKPKAVIPVAAKFKADVAASINPEAVLAKPITKPAKKEQVAMVKAAGQKPEPGSDAWLDYCDNKYASFNRETGTYMSRTGIERRCLVTADFN